ADSLAIAVATISTPATGVPSSRRIAFPVITPSPDGGGGPANFAAAISSNFSADAVSIVSMGAGSGGRVARSPSSTTGVYATLFGFSTPGAFAPASAAAPFLQPEPPAATSGFTSESNNTYPASKPSTTPTHRPSSQVFMPCPPLVGPRSETGCAHYPAQLTRA